MSDINYWQKFISSRLGRRRLLEVTGATAAGTVLLAACGGDDNEDGGGSPGDSSTGSTGSSSGASSGSTGASTGSQGASDGEPVVDRLVMAIEYSGAESNDTRDPSGSESWYLEPIYESLLSHDRETGEIIPGLATEYKIADDGASIWFKIRKGVQFHDGYGEMTADDVVFTYEYQVSDPERGQSMRDFVDHVEKVADDEVVVYLTAPDANAMEWVITDEYIWSSVVSKKHWEEMGDPVGLTTPPLAGTGPWKIKEREAGSFILYERVEDHWRQTPDFPELEVKLISEPSTRLASLLAEEVHVTLLPKDLQATTIDRGMETIQTNVPALRVFLEYWGCCVIDTSTGEYRFPDSPLMDARVRKALNKAIDRDALNEAFLDGIGEPMYVNHFHPTRPGWDESWVERWEEAYGYDPDAAKALLQEAGYSDSNPLETDMLLTYEAEAPGGQDLQETVAGYWNAIGAKVNLLTIDRATARPAAENFEYPNMTMLTTTSSNITVGLRVYQVNNLRSNDEADTGTFRGVNVPGLDEKYDTLLSETNPEKFDTLAREIGEILYTEYASIPFFWVPGEWSVNPKVVAGWSMPGMYGGFVSHLEYIEAVKKT